MLVFKRALNVMLSLSLAFSPTIAFARPSSKRSPSKFVAVSPAARKAKKSTPVAAAKRTSVSAARKPANQQELVQPGDALKKALSFVTKDGSVSVIQTPGFKGRAKTHVVRGPGYEEVWADEYGNGTASKIQVTKDNITVTATNPYFGRYTKLEVEEKRKGGILKSLYRMNPDRTTYRLSSVKVEPYSVAKYNVVIGGKETLTCEQTDTLKKFEDFLKDFSQKIGQSPESALRCKIERFQDIFMDDSCRKDPEFQKSIPHIVAAMAKIYTSPGSTSKPGYLQCIEDRGFAFHSAKIQSTFLQGQQIWSKILGTYQVNLFDNQCSRLETVVDRNTQQTEAVGSILSNMKMVRCDSKLKEPAHIDTQSGQITIGRVATKIASATKEPNANPTDAYAEVLLHEMLHGTGLHAPDGKGGDSFETLTMNMGKCCASPNPNSPTSTKACGDIQKFRDHQIHRAKMETLLSTNMPGYDDLIRITEQQLGEHTDEFMGEWLAGLDSDPDARAAWDAIAKCGAENPSADAKAACSAPQAEKLVNYSNKFFKNECETIEKTTRGINCGGLSKSYANALRTGKPSNGVTVYHSHGAGQTVKVLGNAAKSAAPIPAQVAADAGDRVTAAMGGIPFKGLTVDQTKSIFADSASTEQNWMGSGLLASAQSNATVRPVTLADGNTTNYGGNLDDRPRLGLSTGESPTSSVAAYGGDSGVASSGTPVATVARPSGSASSAAATSATRTATRTARSTDAATAAANQAMLQRTSGGASAKPASDGTIATGTTRTATATPRPGTTAVAANGQPATGRPVAKPAAGTGTTAPAGGTSAGLTFGTAGMTSSQPQEPQPDDLVVTARPDQVRAAQAGDTSDSDAGRESGGYDSNNVLSGATLPNMGSTLGTSSPVRGMRGDVSSATPILRGLSAMGKSLINVGSANAQTVGASIQSLLPAVEAKTVAPIQVASAAPSAPIQLASFRDRAQAPVANLAQRSASGVTATVRSPSSEKDEPTQKSAPKQKESPKEKSAEREGSPRAAPAPVLGDTREDRLAAENAVNPRAQVALAQAIRAAQQSGLAERYPTRIAIIQDATVNTKQTVKDLQAGTQDSPSQREAVLILRGVQVRIGERKFGAANPSSCMKLNPNGTKLELTPCR